MWDVQELFRKHRADIVRFLQRRVSSPEVAADLTQDLFLKLLTLTHSVPVTNGRAYLLSAAGNLAINYRKREKLVEFVYDPDLVDRTACEQPDAERWLLSRDELRVVARTIAEFPAIQREAFILSRVDGLSFAAIGKRLGIPRQRVFDTSCAS